MRIPILLTGRSKRDVLISPHLQAFRPHIRGRDVRVKITHHVLWTSCRRISSEQRRKFFESHINSLLGYWNVLTTTLGTYNEATGFSWPRLSLGHPSANPLNLNPRRTSSRKKIKNKPEPVGATKTTPYAHVNTASPSICAATKKHHADHVNSPVWNVIGHGRG